MSRLSNSDRSSCLVQTYIFVCLLADVNCPVTKTGSDICLFYSFDPADNVFNTEYVHHTTDESIHMIDPVPNMSDTKELFHAFSLRVFIRSSSRHSCPARSVSDSQERSSLDLNSYGERKLLRSVLPTGSCINVN